MPFFSTPPLVAFRRPWPGTRRGLCLWLISLAVMALGLINYVLSEPTSLRPIEAALTLSRGSVDFWGWVMFTVGGVSLFCSFCHFGRDKIGFFLVATFCCAWGMNYVAGWVAYEAGVRALGGAIIWLLFSGLFAAIAGFPNVSLSPPPLLTPDDTKER